MREREGGRERDRQTDRERKECECVVAYLDAHKGNTHASLLPAQTVQSV